MLRCLRRTDFRKSPCCPKEKNPRSSEVCRLQCCLRTRLAFWASGCVCTLCGRLQSQSLAAQEIHLEMTLENGRRDSESTFQRAIHLPVPLLNAQTFLKLLQLDLKAHPPGAPIVKVHLHIVPAKPRPGQAGLFIPCSPEPEKLELT